MGIKIKSGLPHGHDPSAIRKRLEEDYRHNYLGDAVLGGVDGAVTTFAVVAGAVGGGLSTQVIIILGFAKLVADAFSMAVSNYLSTKSRKEQIERSRRTEERHILLYPEGEREEVRQLYRKKGFEGEVLEEIVEQITDNHDLWVDTMLREELGFQVHGPDALHASFATLVAFIGVGLPSLLPFLISQLSSEQAFIISAILTGMIFVMIGLIRGVDANRSLPRSALETLVTGGGAAGLAYLVGSWLRMTFGTA